MKLSLVTIAAAAGAAVAAPAAELDTRAGSVQGFDISSYQPNVDFRAAYNGGARFVMIKATEGTTYKSATFNTQYVGATNNKFIRGGYHFAHPDGSASAQCDYFLANGGGWSNDGITLPGMIDLEGYSGKPKCYGLSASAMIAWIKTFSDRYNAKTGRYPMIYTSPDWWQSCTGNTKTFGTTIPLVLARWASSPGTAPGGWPYHTFWQNADTYRYGGDSEIFNGGMDQLQRFAKGG
ncbi:N,O-diacetylmuramidase [Nannizzia gypsea CBS 118893]|uniref:N,O-diacetylmuramidase n=1 Tax=Arthroderma gypseum (strain ATCC MYA-4604 / CBS 118893) TaxID=535722 RepID=E4V5I6_ARTGP|nr:N,O-diacetylmuramidase [Nannizzia gypsea CBS 118893]EFR05361.1 N,O-diacetylmuramidase [Nannizzia gypsea CBS 118893]